jgi:hypothetical protein
VIGFVIFLCVNLSRKSTNKAISLNFILKKEYIPLLLQYYYKKKLNMKPDLFQSPDYYNLDDLLTDEHKLVRDSARAWVKREVSPIIEEYAQKRIPKQILKGLADIGGFGPIPEEYGGAGLDQISYGLIMQEIERGDSEYVLLLRFNRL